MLPTPTQSTPGGCLLVFFGLLSMLISGMAGYAGYLVHHREVVEHVDTGYSTLPLFGLCGVLLLIGAALVIWGTRLAWRVGAYDTRDPNEPRLKF